MTKPGDNSVLSPENQRMAGFMEQCRIREEINAKIAEMQEEKKKATARAKAMGYTAEMMDYCLKSESSADQAMPLRKLRGQAEILVYLGLMPNGPIDDIFTDRMDAEERHHVAGRKAALLAKPAVSGFSKGSIEDGQWLAGWDEGNSIRMANLAAAVEADEKKATLIKKQSTVKGKAGKASALDSDTPTAPKKGKGANGSTEKPADEEPPKPKKGSHLKVVEAGDDGKTNEEREAERQNAKDFH